LDGTMYDYRILLQNVSLSGSAAILHALIGHGATPDYYTGGYFRHAYQYLHNTAGGFATVPTGASCYLSGNLNVPPESYLSGHMDVVSFGASSDIIRCESNLTFYYNASCKYEWIKTVTTRPDCYPLTAIKILRGGTVATIATGKYKIYRRPR
ncbi:hypothetical protein, partial [Pseudodesulfovibrio sp. JC047]|uniref:hypothetical protein n=1 Tax=Pseudodesulfovibrio sp. JC047 TaxID=2683199 RepID=UPI00193F21FF